VRLRPHITAPVLAAAACAAALVAGGCNNSTLFSTVKPLLITNTCAPGGGAVGMNVNIEGKDGHAIDLAAAQATIAVQTRNGHGPWVDATNVTYDVTKHPTTDTMLVADNSGSEVSTLPTVKAALHGFTDAVLPRPPDDRAGLVRVSTHATLEQPLTTDAPTIDAAIESLHSLNGWTALWDGVRLANEALGADATPGGPISLLRCVDGPFPAIVMFTDGRDNNSADQHSDPANGDHIDTTPAMLHDLNVQGMLTNVTAIGIGPQVDDAALAGIVQAGGRYVHIDGYPELLDAMVEAANLLQQLVPISFTPVDCNQTEALVTVTYQSSSGPETIATTAPIPGSYCQ